MVADLCHVVPACFGGEYAKNTKILSSCGGAKIVIFVVFSRGDLSYDCTIEIYYELWNKYYQSCLFKFISRKSVPKEARTWNNNNDLICRIDLI